jgi:hypothetical protein
MMQISLLAQENSKNNASKQAEVRQYRTAMFMKQSQRINQKIDTFFSKPNPKTATYLSLFPGLGQIYNKKYWKLPIVYAGFGVIGYFAFNNRDYYLQYKEAYACKVNEGDDCEDPLAQNYTAQNLQTIRDGYRRNMELSFIFMGFWYILQMLDATVDAHLYYWEIDETTTLQVQPNIQPANWMAQPAFSKSPPSPGFNGITVSLKF